MYDDPIVNEVRKTREKLVEEAGGYEAYIKKLRDMEKEHPGRLVTVKITAGKTALDAAEM
ncbi:MAG: hypothetical protein Q7J31_13485 [Syntrophales bacterium]|nr:hypothetical protein [Syntrophales bacterium]